MTKFFISFFLGLLIVSGVKAQTDTTRPQEGTAASNKDTTVRHVPARHDSTVRHMTHRDSVRRDSIIRHRLFVQDSIAKAQHPVVDTTHPVAITPARADTPKPAVVTPAEIPYTGPPIRTIWQHALSLNPFFRFTAPFIVEEDQIHHANSKDSLFYLIIGILFYFALIRVFFEKYFGNLMTLFFRVSLRQNQIREQVLQTPLPSLLLNILFVISGGLYASFLLHYSAIGAGIHFWVLFIDCMAALSAIYLLKFLVLKFVGWVFSISRATDIYIFIVFLVNKMLGIFLLPFLIIITFSGALTRQIFITISLAMVFVLWMYRVLAAYRPVRNEIKLTPFYFFLYLCAFEIAPLLLIYKVLLSYLEKVY